MKRSVTFASVLLAVLSAASSLSAASFTWTGSGTGSNLNDWLARQNWNPNTVAPTAADDSIFATVLAGDSLTPTVATAAGIRSITFNPNAAIFNITGAGTLTIGAGGIANNVGNNKTETFSVATVALGASETFSTAGSGTTLFSGTTLSLGGNTLTLSGAGTTIINSSVTGSGGLTKSGSGILTLGGATANTYSGATIVGAGTVNANKASAFGNSSSITLSGGTVVLGADVTSASPVTLSGGTLNQQTTTSTLGALTLGGSTASTINLGASGSLTFASATKTETGLLTINGWQGVAADDVAPTAGTGSRIFFTNPGSVSADFLSSVTFTGAYPAGGQLLGNELVPVPEPQVYAAMFALGLLGFAVARRRLMATA